MDTKYKLYRNVHEIIHPTISKKNISNYRIILDDDLVPLLIFYPQKVSKMNKVIIYLHGDKSVTKINTYNDLCKELAREVSSLIISVDYDNEDYKTVSNSVHKTIKYLIEELKKEDILDSNIILMGDSTGANIIANMQQENKKILFYPPVGGNYDVMLKEKSNFYNQDTIIRLNTYFSTCPKKNNNIFPLLNKNYINNSKCLIIVGTSDPLYEENLKFHKLCKNRSKILELELLNHGFLSTKDIEIKKIVVENIKKFI